MSLFQKKSENFEFLPLLEQKEFQKQKLKKILTKLKNKGYYAKALKEFNVADIDESWSKIDLTDRKSLEENRSEIIAVKDEAISEIVSTSGTTGKPFYLPLTDNDLARLSAIEELAFKNMGVDSHSKVILAVTMDRLFMAGLAYYLGAKATGASVYRMGPASIEALADLSELSKADTIVAVPSTLRKLLEYLKNNNKKTHLKKALLIGEPIRKEDFSLSSHAEKIQSLHPMELFTSYGASEIQGSFVECSEGKGSHVHPQYFYSEIVDEQGCVLPNGEKGELVVTPLGVEALPLLRFRTGDITSMTEAPCECGRNSPRLGPIIGRLSQRMKVKGVSLFPSALHGVLDKLYGVHDYIVEVESDSEGSDSLRVRLSLSKGIHMTEQEIQDKIAVKTRVKPEVVIEKIETLQSQINKISTRKKVRFLDLREK